MGSRPIVVEAAGEQSDVIWERLAKLFTALSFENPGWQFNLFQGTFQRIFYYETGTFQVRAGTLVHY